MTIYTKTGDAGETGLFGGGRVDKSDARVDAYGEVDELNAQLGLCRSLGLDPELDTLLERLQHQLFVLGGIIATPPGTKAMASLPQLDAAWVAEMERAIDRFDLELKPLTNFILPGGATSASALHVARTVCRRAERRVVALQRAEKVDVACVVYLNRLSDLLFTLARAQNHRSGVPDVLWLPKK